MSNSFAKMKANKKWHDNNKEKSLNTSRKIMERNYMYKLANDINIQFKILRKMDIFN